MESLRRRCERRLRGIRVPEPFDLDAFCREVESHRGRRLLRRAVPGLSAGAPCGLWIGTDQADHVFYDPGTSPLHAEHIVLHELAHILSEHHLSEHSLSEHRLSERSLGEDTLGHDGSLAHLFPDLDPATISRMLGRVAYTTAQEREAEMMASLIRGRSARPPHTTLGRVAHALGFPE